MKKTVLLTTGTTGVVYGDCMEGQKVTVKLADENGNDIYEEGIVKEVLEEEEY